MQVFIHIGHHKTATTWLQQSVFPSLPGVEFWNVYSQEYSWIAEIGRVHDFEFDVGRYNALRDAALFEKAKRRVLISWEGFVGDPFTGAQTSRRNADRLAAVFPKAKILIGIRNQLDTLESLYKQYVQEGGVYTMKRFLSLCPPERVYFSLDYLRYDRIVGYYSQLFGHDSVFTYLYEVLRKAPDSFVDELNTFLGLESKYRKMIVPTSRPNRSLSIVSLRLLRFSNRFLGSTLNPTSLISNRFMNNKRMRRILQARIDPLLPERFFPNRYWLKPDEQGILEDQFRESNRALSTQFCLPLAEHGYPL